MSIQPAFSAAVAAGPPKKTDTAEVIERDLTSPNLLDDSIILQQSPEEAEEDRSLQEAQDRESKRWSERWDSGNDLSATPPEADHESQKPATQTDPKHCRIVKKRASFWDFFRASNGELCDREPQRDAEKLNRLGEKQNGKQEEHSDQPNEKATSMKPSSDSGQECLQLTKGTGRGPANNAGKTLRRQSSRLSFTLSMPWTQTVRRNTDASVYSTVKAEEVMTAMSDHETCTSDRRITRARMPSKAHTMLDVHQTLAHDGKKIADDAVRFAHARHVIRTAENVERLRELATELEEAFRQQLEKVSLLHAQMEAMHWRLNDLHDENRHLRSQLGSLSEQIVERQTRLDALSADDAQEAQKPTQTTVEEEQAQSQTKTECFNGSSDQGLSEECATPVEQEVEASKMKLDSLAAGEASLDVLFSAKMFSPHDVITPTATPFCSQP